MAVNDEPGQLERALDAAPTARTQRPLAVITFHSLEDRMVKRRFRDAAGENSLRDPYGNPLHPPAYRLVHRRGIAGKDVTQGTRVPALPGCESSKNSLLPLLDSTHRASHGHHPPLDILPHG